MEGGKPLVGEFGGLGKQSACSQQWRRSGAATHRGAPEAESTWEPADARLSLEVKK